MHRKIRTTVRLGLGVVLGATAAPRTLHAQATSPAAASAAALTPPRLLTFVPAARPAEAADVTEEVSVELSLSIDRAGAVTDAAVVRGAGRGFDEAAVAAARGFVFAPARRGDVAIPVRIRYRYVFVLDKAPPPARARRAPPDAREPAPRAGRAEG
jgi:TonB family protein